MALARRENMPAWDPFREMEEMSRRFERLMRSPLMRTDGEREALRATEWAPSVDIAETDNAYEINAELPGVKKDDVHVNVEKGVLTLQGERRQEKEESRKRFHRTESMYGSFMRRFTLPDDASEDQISATFKDGVLHIEVPKSAQAQPKTKQIQVQ